MYIEEKGASLIDYILANEKSIEEVMQVTEGERTESNHMLLEVTIKGHETEQSSRSKDAERKGGRAISRLRALNITLINVRGGERKKENWKTYGTSLETK